MSEKQTKARPPRHMNANKRPPRNQPSNQVLLEKLVHKYFEDATRVKDATINNELEVKFGTKGVKPFTKMDYDNVIRKLKSFGFNSTYEEGMYLMRITYEYLDKSGQYKDSPIRVEITGFRAIQEYCKTNDISKILHSDQYQGAVKFVKKTRVFENNEPVSDVNFSDFNFRVSYRKEEELSPSNIIVRSTLQNWMQTKKAFRYINRVSFSHPDLPIDVDISIVKSSQREKYSLKKTYTTDEAGVFTNTDTYEMEIEVNNRQIGPATDFNNAGLLLASMRKAIKYILMGLQGTNYPVSVVEQQDMLHEYMKLVHKDNYNESKRVYPKNFIGPSSYTLQIENIMPEDDNMNVPNIRKDYVVTDKADGERHLLYVSSQGKIYLITTNMNVVFTGAVTEEETLFHSLYDGELILHNKNRQFINLFAIFDVYYVKGVDVRHLRFMMDTDDEKTLYRYKIIQNTISILKAKSVVKDEISPMRIESKRFYPRSLSESPSLQIFGACKHILDNVSNGLFEYETDGLIFTHAHFGVGTDQVGKAGPLYKVTWDYSFKWKPSSFNTIDFLVVTKKMNGEDIVTPIFQPGKSSTDLDQYKTIELRCGFNQRIHGYLNPCQDVYEDRLPEYGDKDDATDYRPVVFVPTNPYDPEAGICNIMLKRDDTGVLQMFSEDDEVFENNTIVEFRYELTREKKWRWVPLRVRNDKTTELRQGISLNYGNAYHVAESNWRSIHNPITSEMITSGFNINTIEVDEDVYYNRIVKSNKTIGLRSFHNYIKSRLIRAVSNKGDTLIDYACGKGGDFSKWTDAQLSFVFGIDNSSDNLENKMDGACARFLNYKKTHRNVPYVLFVAGDTGKNIKNGDALKSDKGIQITRAVFGEGGRDESRLGKGVLRQYGKAADGFNVSSCQFALHYFFKDLATLQNFVRNVSECTKLGGYFVSTAYDGKSVFNMLKNKELDDGVSIYESDAKIWEIKKRYSLQSFEDDSSSLGYTIDVFQETINQSISEYLVNYDYFTQVMEDYGFQLVTTGEASELGLPGGSGLFSDLYSSLLDKKNKSKNAMYADAINMNEYEKKISFLNRYVVFKKIRIVNTAKVILEETEESADSVAMKRMDVSSVTEVVDDNVKLTDTNTKGPAKSKQRAPRKLSKKLVIVDDTTS